MILEKKGKLPGLHRKINVYAKSQEEIDRIISERLGSIKFSCSPKYNGHLINGKAVFDSRTGKIKKLEIGKQESPSDDFLTDTLLHEELEARIVERAFRGVKKFQRMLNEGDGRTHPYIYSVIVRYFKFRGWKK